MTQKISYLIDLGSQKYTETDGVVSSWIQAMPLGNYSHPVYGPINITTDKVVRFADNVTKNIRQTELDIDYDHKEYSGEAAGWVKQAEARLTETDPKKNGLWVLVEWTSKAWEAIKSKAYRYFSPEFDDEWTDPKSGETFTDVLFGGGITNRPFLKDILPLNLSEKFSELEGTPNMTPEQIKELFALLGLEDSASFDEIKAKFAALDASNADADKAAADKAAAEAAANDAANSGELVGADSVGLSEADVKKLSENPVMAKMLKAFEAQSVQLMEMKISDTVTKLNEKFNAKGIAMAPNTKTSLSEILKVVDGKTASLITKLCENFASGHATVKLTEPKINDPGNRDNVKKFSDRVAEIVKEKNVDYRQAAIMAAAEDNDSFDTHRQGDE